MGVKVSLGHSADNVIGVDMVVYSAAIAKDNVELNAAASYGIPTIERSVLLGYVSRLYKESICVSGTHGKTTTTSMITTALELAGRILRGHRRQAAPHPRLRQGRQGRQHRH